MKFIKKYILLIFLIENLLVQSPIFGMSMLPFYIMMVLGALLIFSKELWSHNTYRECKPLYLLALVYIVYQFTLGFNTLSMQTLVYLMAKISTFIIITVSIANNWDFYAKKAPIYLAMIVVVILVLGLNDATDSTITDRQTLGFGNANTTSSLSTFCLTGVLFLWNRKHRIVYFFIAILAIYSMLAGGSRNAILMLGVSMLVWTGTSVRRMIPAAMALLLVWGTINIFQLDLAGVERLKGTIEGSIGTNRDLEREATLMMIEEKPWTGWGFEAENQGRAATISEMGSHNGYLDTIKFIGYPFALLFFVILFICTFSLLKYAKSKDMVLRYHLAIVLSHMVGAMYEGLFVGVHEFSTNMIFYSLAILTTYDYRMKRDINTNIIRNA